MILEQCSRAAQTHIYNRECSEDFNSSQRVPTVSMILINRTRPSSYPVGGGRVSGRVM